MNQFSYICWFCFNSPDQTQSRFLNIIADSHVVYIDVGFEENTQKDFCHFPSFSEIEQNIFFIRTV